jgi:hypothetical protein
MRTDLFEYTILNHFLSALINGDDSGLSDDEIAQLKVFEGRAVRAAQKEGASHWHWSVQTECSNFARCDVCGMLGDVSDVALVMMFKEGSENEMHAIVS